jgi:hypothetical protein
VEKGGLSRGGNPWVLNFIFIKKTEKTIRKEHYLK